MKSVYVDTAALLALGHKRDNFHNRAISVYRSLRDDKVRFVTTNAVVMEVGNACSPPAVRRVFIEIIHMIDASEYWEYVIVDKRIMDAAQDLFARRMDKAWSLVDCIGMNVARSVGADQIFTTDKHFMQAGFEILLTS